MTLDTGPQRPVWQMVDEVTVHVAAVGAARFSIERPGSRTDLDIAQRVVDWVMTDGADPSVRLRALIASKAEVGKPVSIEEFLELCATMERFLLGERPYTPDRTDAGR